MLIENLFGHQLTRNSDTKALIFAALGERGTLSIAELTRFLHSRFKVKRTYQAIRKAVRSLRTNEAVQLEGKKYSINRSWLLRIRRDIDRIISATPRLPSYESRQTDKDTNFTIYNLETLYDLDIFWGDVANEICRTIKRPKGMPYFSISHRAWWLPMNLGRETKFWRSLIQRGFEPTMILDSSSSFNRSAARIYRGVEMDVRLKRLEGHDAATAYNFVGTNVIQATLSPKAVIAVDRFCSRYSTVHRVDPADADQLAHAAYDLKLTVINDQSLAANLRRAYGLPPP